MTRRNRYLLIALAVGVPFAASTCRTDASRAAEESESQRVATPGAATGQQATVSWRDLANATYAGIFDEPVRLTNGRWEGEPFVPGAASRPSLQLIDDFWANGDLDGDGTPEAVVFLAESSGGSGSRVYIAAVGWRAGQPVNVGTALIGDRVQLRTLRLVDDRVELDVVQQGPEDAACCPTQKATRTWKLESEGLGEAAPQITGRLSLVDLGGVEWSLTHFDWNEPAPTGLAITLTVEDGQITGSSGCNRYFAGIEESQPGSVTVSAIGSTRMACPEEVMEIESRYLEALDGVTKYSFLAGRLALSYQSGETFHTLLFAAGAQTAEASSARPRE